MYNQYGGQEVDIRFVSPLLLFCDEAYELCLKHIGIDEEYLFKFLAWIRRINAKLFIAFEVAYKKMMSYKS